MTTAQLILAGHGPLARMFASSPWRIFLWTSITAVIGLLLPAALVGVHWIKWYDPTRRQEVQLGLFAAPNWSVMYTLGVPAILALAAWVFERMRISAAKLCSEQTPIFWNERKEEPSGVFEPRLASELASRAAALTWGALALTLAISVADTWDVWFAFYSHMRAGTSYAGLSLPHSLLADWDTAFRLPGYERHPSIWSNLAFDVIAYTFQGAAIFFGVFIVGKVWMFIHAVARVIGSDDSECRFTIIETDEWLGLRSLGAVFDGFLAITVIFLGYVFFHRLQTVGRFRGGGAWGYTQELIQNTVTTNIQYVLDGKNYWWSSIDAGMALLLLFLTVPPIVICYLPMWRIRGHVNAKRIQAYDANVLLHDKAVRDGEEERAKELKQKMKVLEFAQVWPNGDQRAQRFLFVMSILALGAYFPPLVTYLIGGGIALAVFSSIARGRGTR